MRYCVLIKAYAACIVIAILEGTQVCLILYVRAALGDLIIVSFVCGIFPFLRAYQHSAVRHFRWFKAPNLGVETTPAAGHP